MKKVLYIIAIFTAFGSILSLADEKKLPEETLRRLEKVKANEVDIEFYGRILDQHSQPVSGAIVTISVDQVTLLPKDKLKLQVTSDSNGEFKISPKDKAIRGTAIYIRSIEKNGYELSFIPDAQSRFAYQIDNPHRFLSDANKPVVFHMRKKELAPTILLFRKNLKFETQLKDSGKTSGYDCIQLRVVKNLAKPRRAEKSLKCDIKITATFDVKDSKWTVTLSSGDGNGGIIVSDQLLYEAPGTGYHSQYSFTASEDIEPTKEKYIYLKSRNPAIYSRLTVDFINSNKEFFRLRVGDAVTNPYGERNLEQATDIPYRIVQQLIDEAQAAFRQNKRPVKPDIPMLIKEAKEKNKDK